MDNQLTIICFALAAVQLVGGEYGDRIKNATVTWGSNLQMEESRHAYAFAPYPVESARTELPVTFQAPYINARDYWNDPARRAGADYSPHLISPITDGINAFYGIMQQFFGDEPPPQPPPLPRPSPPPHKQFQTSPYFLPPQKPLRASIQKLEPPRSHFPSYQESQLPSQAKFPHFVKLFSDVMENNYKEPVLENPEYIYDYIVPTTYKPSYNRFRYRTTTAPPATTFPVSIQDQLPPVKHGQDTRIPYVTDKTTPKPARVTPSTRIIFPPSTEPASQLDYELDVRSSLRPTRKPAPTLANIISTTETSPLKTELPTAITPAVRPTTPAVPTITTDWQVEQVTNQPFETASQQAQTILDQSETTISLPTTNFPTSTISGAEVQVTEIVPTVPVPTAADAIPVTDTSEMTTELTSEVDFRTPELLNSIEGLEPKRFKGPFGKKMHSQVTTDPTTTSADYVTDLTVQGLTDANAVHASVPRYLQAPSVTSVIGYVLNEFNATINNEPVDDTLNLDAKILKDTNWDGFQPIIPTRETTETTTDTTSSTTTTVEIATNPSTTTVETTTLMSITEEPEDPPSTETLAAATENNLQTTESLPETTTNTIIEPISTSSTASPTTAEHFQTSFRVPDPPAEKENYIVATRMTQSISLGQANNRDHEERADSYPSPRGLPDDDEEDTTLATTTSTAAATTKRARKYKKRPRVKSFTPKPQSATSTETNLSRIGTFSRQFYPTRVRPNATLTFSSRAGERNAEREEQPAQAQEQTQKRRNLYRRRNYPSQLRRSSTEPQTAEGA